MRSQRKYGSVRVLLSEGSPYRARSEANNQLNSKEVCVLNRQNTPTGTSVPKQDEVFQLSHKEARAGALWFLQAPLGAAVEENVKQFSETTDSAGNQAVVKNGHARPLSLETEIHSLEVRGPHLDERKGKQQNPNLPIALRTIRGDEIYNIPVTMITRMRRQWQAEDYHWRHSMRT